MTFTPAVMARRRKGVGASEVPAILGLSPWQTPMNVWFAKQPDYTPAPETEAQRNGHRMEPVILSVFAKETGLDVKPNSRLGWDHVKGSRLFCTPDGFVKLHNRLVQAKCVGPRMADSWGTMDDPWETAVPDYVIAQVQAECAVEEAEGCYVATCIQSFAGLTWPHWYVPADPELGAGIRQTVTEWYNEHVVGNVPPAETVIDHANLSLYRIKTQPLGPVGERTEEWEQIATRLLKMKAAQSFLGKRIKEAEALLYAGLGEHTGGVDGLFTVGKRKGSVSYKSAVEALCPGANLEPYRGEGSPQIKWVRGVREQLGLKPVKQIGEDTSDE